MTKTNRLPEIDLSDNAAVSAGRHFEGGIAAWAAEKWGLKLRKVRRYFVDDECPGLGASLDFEAYGDGDGLIPVENKFSIRGYGFECEGDEITEVPDHYAMQLQHQLCVTGAPYGFIVALIDGDLKRIRMERREKIIASIRREVAQFWLDVKELREPPVDFAADAEAISRLAAINPLCRVDLPKECEKLAAEYLVAKSLEREHEKRADAARAEILKTMLDMATAKGATVDEQSIRCDIGGFRISASMVAGGPGTLITPELVGTYYGARKAYRRMMISEPKAKGK